MDKLGITKGYKRDDGDNLIRHGVKYSDKKHHYSLEEMLVVDAAPEMLERDIKFREYLFNEIDKYIKMGDTGMVYTLREVWRNFDFTIDEKATSKTCDEIKKIYEESK